MITELALATPIILTADLSPAELQWEWERMVKRSFATTALIRGEITVDDWEMALDELGVDVIQADQDWAEGRFYL